MQMWDWQGPFRKHCWVLGAGCILALGPAEVRRLDKYSGPIVLTTRVHIAYRDLLSWVHMKHTMIQYYYKQN